MSDKPADAKPEEKKDAAKPAKKAIGGAILGILLPAILAAGGSFGAVKLANKGAGHAEPAHPPPPPRWEPRPPGPTIALEPFLVTVTDENKKNHPMKLTIAIEFEAAVKEETLKAFTPRIRDAVLVYVRSLQFEDVADARKGEKIREEILERCRKAGAVAAERVLVTDMVVQ
jgi:flagellar basal body-associated protein FliL